MSSHPVVILGKSRLDCERSKSVYYRYDNLDLLNWLKSDEVRLVRDSNPGSHNHSNLFHRSIAHRPTLKLLTILFKLGGVGNVGGAISRVVGLCPTGTGLTWHFWFRIGVRLSKRKENKIQKEAGKGPNF